MLAAIHPLFKVERLAAYEWHDLGAAHFDRADATKTANRLIRRLQQIGYVVQATPA
ncbi:MAG: hypothetical protein ACYCSR_14770 [Thiomonas sp.]